MNLNTIEKDKSIGLLLKKDVSVTSVKATLVAACSIKKLQDSYFKMNLGAFLCCLFTAFF